SLMQEDGFPAEYRAGRLLNPRDGELDPAAAVDALAQGGQVIEGCEVTSLSADGVETSRGDLQAATVVLATNAYTPQLLAAAPITHRWAGIMGFTPDSLPLVGPVPGRSGLFVCGGYTGHGLGFAFNAARRLVGLLLDGQEPPSWMAAARLAWRTPG